jgi:hypothetical protein
LKLSERAQGRGLGIIDIELERGEVRPLSVCLIKYSETIARDFMKVHNLPDEYMFGLTEYIKDLQDDMRQKKIESNNNNNNNLSSSRADNSSNSDNNNNNNNNNNRNNLQPPQQSIQITIDDDDDDEIVIDIELEQDLIKTITVKKRDSPLVKK